MSDPSFGVLEAARREVAYRLAWDRGEEPPTDPQTVGEYIAKYALPVYDPFAGGGSILWEVQRLGLKAYAGDLSLMAVLINKAVIEIPPRFSPPVNLTPRPPLPQGEGELEKWKVPPAIRRRCRRRESTPSEAILWEALRNRKLEGRKFRRQHPIGTFVVDSFCKEEALMAEVDGPIHKHQIWIANERNCWKA